MEELISKDTFLSYTWKKDHENKVGEDKIKALKSMFKTYVIGDAVMEREYGKL